MRRLKLLLKLKTNQLVSLRRMAQIETIHASKQPRRPHFIREWAEKRGLEQADLVRDLGADKGVVSRWYSGSSPGVDWQEKLAAYFGCTPDALFRHPDDDWMAKFFAGRKREEIDRIKHMLEVAFPRKDGTEG